MPKLVLYHFPPSAPSRAALLTIRNLNLDVEIKKVDLFKKEQLNDDFVKINPQHVVPTIDDDGFILWESRAISQYLVETHAADSSLLPKDPKQRAIVNQRLYFDLGTLYARLRAICFPILFLGETTISDTKRQQLYEAFEWMEKFLEGNTWFAGETMTIADLSILTSLSSIVHVGANISKYKNLSAWYERCRKVPGFEENEEGAMEFSKCVKNNLKDTL